MHPNIAGMSSQTATDEAEPLDETALEEADMPITAKRLVTAFVGGVAGVVLMVPLLVGVPWVLNLFRTEPLLAFAEFGRFLALEPSLPLAIYMFLFGGIVLLPLIFLVVGAFLPPKRPRYARGVPFATIFWAGFIFVFWPGGGMATLAVFLVVSLVGHWLYGVTLAFTLDGLVGIPEHSV